MTEVQRDYEATASSFSDPVRRVEDDSADDHHGLLTAATTATVDDRHARHITHDNRLLGAPVLRQRLDHLGNCRLLMECISHPLTCLQ